MKKHINFNRIKNIDVRMVVVGDVHRDSVKFYEHNIGGSPFGGLVRNKKKAPETFAVKKRQLVCLDDFCKDNQFFPDVIKIDVEGSELQVLKGAQTILKESNPSIFLSVHPSHLEAMGQSVKDIEEFLNKLGYQVVLAGSNKPGNLASGENICVKIE